MRRLCSGSPHWVIRWSEWIVDEFVNNLLKQDPKSLDSESKIFFQVPSSQLEKADKKLTILFVDYPKRESNGSYYKDLHLIRISFPLESLAYIGIVDMDGHRYKDQIRKLIDWSEIHGIIEHELIHAYRSTINPGFLSETGRLNRGQSRQLKSEFPQIKSEYLDYLLQSRSIHSDLKVDDYIVPQDQRKIRKNDTEYWIDVSQALQAAAAGRYMNDEEEMLAWVADHAREIFNTVLKPKLAQIDTAVGESPESIVQRLLADEEFEIELRIRDEKNYRSMLTRIYKYLTQLCLQYLRSNPTDAIKIERSFMSKVNRKAYPWIQANRDDQDFFKKIQLMLDQWCREVYREYSNELNNKQDLLKVQKLVRSKLLDRYTKMFK